MKHVYIKEAIIGTTLGAALIFGMAVSSSAHSTSDVNAKWMETNIELLSIDDDKDIDADTAKNTANQGYMYGFKRGEKDRNGKKKFKDTVTMPYQDSMLTPIIPSSRYKKFYDAGYTRGYEDGFNNTTKYGTATKLGKETGYSMKAEVLTAVVQSPTSDKNSSSPQ